MGIDRVHERGAGVRQEQTREADGRMGLCEQAARGLHNGHDDYDDGRAAGAVLLTGATGFVGMQLLMRYLERTGSHVYALVRGASPSDAADRMERTMRLLFGPHHPYAARVTPLLGDITHPRLGLSENDCDALAERVEEIVHGAASVSFDLDLETARGINVRGTEQVLRFARRCNRRGTLRRMSYISTAYVCGTHRGCFSEDELEVGQEFHNAYEQSKFEAERLVRASAGELALTVLRPSIVVGERSSGWTTSFNVLYWPLRAYAKGAYSALPARRGAPVDAVPVDYVADAIFHLTRAREAEGATFHLTAGSNASTVGEIVELAAAYFQRPAPRLVDPGLYRRMVHPLLLGLGSDERRQRALRRSEVFFPYFAMRATFDERRARVALRGSGISPSPLSAYFNRLVEFALAAEWGRRQLPHPRSLELAAQASPQAHAGQWWNSKRTRSAAGRMADASRELAHTL